MLFTNHSYCIHPVPVLYCIAQNFCGRKLWWCMTTPSEFYPPIIFVLVDLLCKATSPPKCFWTVIHQSFLLPKVSNSQCQKCSYLKVFIYSCSSTYIHFITSMLMMLFYVNDVTHTSDAIHGIIIIKVIEYYPVCVIIMDYWLYQMLWQC